jgi:hypothetical membrane protein
MLQPMQQKHTMMTLRILWGALLLSTSMLFLVLKFVLPEGEASPITPKKMQTWYMFFGMACVFLLASYLLPKFILKQAAQRKPSTMEEMLQLYATPFIMSLAMTEAVSLVGFAFSFTSREIQSFYPFFALSVIFFLMRFPTEEKIKAIFKA